MRFVTEVTELVGLGTVLYRTLPASPGFGMVLYRTLPASPGFGMQGIPHTRVPVQSCYRNYRTLGYRYEVVTEVTELVGLGTLLYRTLPASPGFGMKDIPHARVPVRSCYRSHRTCRVGYSVVQSFTNLPRVRYSVVQKSQNLSGTGNTRVCTPVLQKSVPYRTQPWFFRPL